MSKETAQDRLDQIDLLIDDIRRARAASNRYLMEGKPRLAFAQARLIAQYVDTLVMRTTQLQEALLPMPEGKDV
jgi:hypothetical protein